VSTTHHDGTVPATEAQLHRWRSNPGSGGLTEAYREGQLAERARAHIPLPEVPKYAEWKLSNRHSLQGDTMGGVWKLGAAFRDQHGAMTYLLWRALR